MLHLQLPVRKSSGVEEFNGYVCIKFFKNCGKGVTIYNANSEESGKKVIIKKIELSKKNHAKVLTEVWCSQLYKHENVVNYLETVELHNCQYIIFEDCPLGTLKQYILKNGPLPDVEIYQILNKILNLLHYLADNNMYFKKLDCDDLYVVKTSSGTSIKLANFSEIAITEDKQFPESILDAHTLYGYFTDYRTTRTKFDTKFLGLIMFSMLSGSPLKSTDSYLPETAFYTLKRDAAYLVKSMLEIRDDVRMSDSAILKTNFFARCKKANDEVIKCSNKRKISRFLIEKIILN